jgi:superfamily II DNA or RNA helicase
LTDPNCIDTFYCTYDTFFEHAHLIPANSTIFVDEVHLFFKEALRIVNNKLVAPTEILKCFNKVIALSATFGGQQGIAEAMNMFPESLFIKSP